jgi:hypothetical protein
MIGSFVLDHSWNFISFDGVHAYMGAGGFSIEFTSSIEALLIRLDTIE